MTDPRNLTKYSPHRRLPSFSILSGNLEGTSHARQKSVQEEQPDENSESLRRQLAIRDQIIASLRTEYSRIQAVCDRLDTKSQVMDRELAIIVEEKTELRKQVDSLLLQIEKLMRDKETLSSQSQADATQWRQIMSMSSRLQMQGADEQRRFASEREAWARERYELETRINTAQIGGGSLQRIDTSESSDVGSSVEPPQRTSSLTSRPDEHSQLDIRFLRERCCELEEILSEILKETPSIERTSKLFREARRRLGASGEAEISERKRVRS